MGDLGKKLPKVKKSPDLVTLVMFTFDRFDISCQVLCLSQVPSRSTYALFVTYVLKHATISRLDHLQLNMLQNSCNPLWQM